MYRFKLSFVFVTTFCFFQFGHADESRSNFKSRAVSFLNTLEDSVTTIQCVEAPDEVSKFQLQKSKEIFNSLWVLQKDSKEKLKNTEFNQLNLRIKESMVQLIKQCGEDVTLEVIAFVTDDPDNPQKDFITLAY